MNDPLRSNAFSRSDLRRWSESVLTRQVHAYTLPKRGKSQALTLDGVSSGLPITGRDSVAALPFGNNPNEQMQHQKLDDPRAVSSFYIWVCPRAPATVRRPPSVRPLEPGEKRRASVAEQRSTPRSGGGEQRRLPLARNVPGYAGEAVGGEADCCRWATPPCHRGPTPEGVSKVSPLGLQGDTSVTPPKSDVAPKELTFTRLFQTADEKAVENFLGVSKVSPPRGAPDLLLGAFHE